ncbi:MobA/MobL family protein [Erythrobacter sp. LQ02-29]|uniref:MobA/MobL family protein n=1 Tax=Erythrobacter sp. LQ02-29 TaxID=2920384 RepID=UPI001F4DD068|nr:MobA/MobL family protein [Erythrobacter sp. LQ02-29]MCP9223140.1 MobA/MobL family protein [Erythrobacter sp. LQ02-29]
MSSIHFEFVPRGFASKKDRAWRAGEAERASLYITAHDSLEDGELGWRSSVANDRNEMRTFWRALEAVERHDRANANVYITEVIELPCEASPRLRRRMVKRIAQRLERRGLAYVAAIHKPDRGGDQRNFHLHLMYSLRPSDRIAPYEWEFGISKVGDINTKDGIRERRRCVVRDINATLHAAHLGKRYTALSNGARGLEPSMQTKVGQKKTWANRRLLAAEQKVDEIHRLLAIAADLRATVERVQQAVKKAKLRVVTELRRKAREIAEREGQRAVALSEIAVKVDQAKLALQMREDRARVSAAFEELFAETMPVAPIAEIPRNSESTNARTVSDVSPKPTRRPPLALTEAIPVTVGYWLGVSACYQTVCGIVGPK